MPYKRLRLCSFLRRAGVQVVSIRLYLSDLTDYTPRDARRCVLGLYLDNCYKDSDHHR